MNICKNSGKFRDLIVRGQNLTVNLETKSDGCISLQCFHVVLVTVKLPIW